MGQPMTFLKVTAAVLERDGRILIARRKRNVRFGGLWEFPGGKLEAGESPEEGLRRELREELGIEAQIKDFIGSFPYAGPSLAVELLAFRASHVSGRLRLSGHDRTRWVLPSELPTYTFTEPDRLLIRALEESRKTEYEESSGSGQGGGEKGI